MKSNTRLILKICNYFGLPKKNMEETIGRMHFIMHQNVMLKNYFIEDSRYPQMLIGIQHIRFDNLYWLSIERNNIVSIEPFYFVKMELLEQI